MRGGFPHSGRGRGTGAEKGKCRLSELSALSVKCELQQWKAWGSVSVELRFYCKPRLCFALMLSSVPPAADLALWV